MHIFLFLIPSIFLFNASFVFLDHHVELQMVSFSLLVVSLIQLYATRRAQKRMLQRLYLLGSKNNNLITGFFLLLGSLTTLAMDAGHIQLANALLAMFLVCYIGTCVLIARKKINIACK